MTATSTTRDGMVEREVRLSTGTVRYVEAGEGPVLLFVHGVFVNGQLWGEVLPKLAGSFRCVVPDLPLGAHSRAMDRGADLSPPAIARLIEELATTLGLDDVTLVGNDTGGALCQLVVANDPAWVNRLVLTSCDAFEVFPPRVLLPLTFAPGPVLGGLAQLLRLQLARRAFAATVAKRRPDDALLGSVFRPLMSDAAVRRDLGKFLAGASKRQTLEAGEKLHRFDRPVLIVWAEDDLFFPMRLAERLQRSFPRARLERVSDARTFIPLDQPDLLVRLVTEFAGERRSS
jgi:pimeloyl-ACP methyl ester carboxylesterase